MEEVQHGSVKEEDKIVPADLMYLDSLDTNQRKFFAFVIPHYEAIKQYDTHRFRDNEDPVLQIAKKGYEGKTVRKGPKLFWSEKQCDIVRWLLVDLHQYTPDCEEPTEVDSFYSPDKAVNEYQRLHNLRPKSCTTPAAIVQLLVYSSIFPEPYFGDPWNMIDTIYQDQENRNNKFSWCHWGRNSKERVAYRYAFDLPSRPAYRKVHYK